MWEALRTKPEQAACVQQAVEIPSEQSAPLAGEPMVALQRLSKATNVPSYNQCLPTVFLDLRSA